MNIPNPKAKQGERVLVSNYRRNGIWQEGKVISLEYKNSWRSWSWGYDVSVCGKNGKYYRLYVGNKRIKKFVKQVEEVQNE